MGKDHQNSKHTIVTTVLLQNQITKIQYFTHVTGVEMCISGSKIPVRAAFITSTVHSAVLRVQTVEI